MDTIYTWDKVDRFDSTDTDVCKFVFTNETAVAEAVLYKYGTYKERTVICCSTQSGCPMGCTFCGTGKQFVRNLTSTEILEQIEVCLDKVFLDEANPDEIKSLQIMFMSQGEPMLNWKQLKPALRTLYKRYPHAKLLISTSAPAVNYEPLVELSKEIPTIGLQFSVHESLQEQRNKLIPFKAKLSLRDISDVGIVWCRETGRKPFYNYCVHEGNNSEEDAQRLAELFPVNVFSATISVICEADETVASSIDRQQELASDFAGLLVGLGFDTRVFNPAGQDDIGGGCGQLWYVQEWMKDNPKYVREMNYECK